MRDQNRYNCKPSSGRIESGSGSGSGRGDHNRLIMFMRNSTGSSGSSNSSKAAAWLKGLMRETFFGECGAHEGLRKNEKNVFCLLCCLPICLHCLPHHPSHPFLQVRRYVYQDVVRLDELEKLIDCSFIQPYTINSAKVIFLNQRPQTKPSKDSANLCFTCDRILQQPFHFCSLSCKVNYMMDQGEDLSAIDVSDYASSQLEGLRMDNSDFIDEEDGQTSSSSSLVMEEPISQYRNSSSRADETIGSPVISHDRDMALMSNKNKSNSFLPRVVLSLSSRRKGAPQRAPLS